MSTYAVGDIVTLPAYGGRGNYREFYRVESIDKHGNLHLLSDKWKGLRVTTSPSNSRLIKIDLK